MNERRTAIDLNCDVGEGAEHDAALMPHRTRRVNRDSLRTDALFIFFGRFTLEESRLAEESWGRKKERT